jgi:polysaccharide pyruvyl transferase WcaK-like protein
MTNIAIVGVTLSGNMGGQAMLLATLEAMRQRCPDCQFDLISIYPEADKKLNNIADLNIVSAPAPQLVGLYLPISVILWSLIKLPLVHLILVRIPYFQALLRAQLVIDLCGISFVDGRGLPLLLYNMACCLPAIILGTPVVKLAQAVGPFKQTLNRRAAQFTLSRCAAVIARGESSEKNLADLNLSNTKMLPDVTFGLQVPEAAKQKAKAILASHNIQQKPLIVSPSRVVERLCLKAGIDFVEEMSAVVKEVAKCGLPVVVLPHSCGKGLSKNNDVVIGQAMLDRLPQDLPVYLIDNIEDAILLRALIGEARLFLGCRFHSVVAALAMGIPCIVVGWSHKYAETVAPFGLTNWVFDLSAFSAKTMFTRIQALQEQDFEIRQQIQAALPAVAKQAALNFDVAMQVLNSGKD